MNLKLAENKDVDKIVEIIKEAKDFLKNKGSDQWQGFYPAKVHIEEDVDKSRAYVYKIKGEVAAYVCLDFEGDPAYKDIKGQWLSENPYIAIHRLAVGKKYRGQGLISKLLKDTDLIARDNNFASVKVDTDPKNKIMQHIVQKNGYIYCGTVIQDGNPKVAYEKII